MNEDQELQQQIARQHAELNKLMREEQGLPALLAAGLRGGMSLWMKVAYVIAVLLAVAIFYCGYRFFSAPATDQLYWGMLLLLSIQLQVGTKLWIWLESQRAGTLRELKKVQLALAQLQQQKPD
jgi:hypothetical protein